MPSNLKRTRKKKRAESKHNEIYSGGNLKIQGRIQNESEHGKERELAMEKMDLKRMEFDQEEEKVSRVSCQWFLLSSLSDCHQNPPASTCHQRPNNKELLATGQSESKSHLITH